MDLFISSLLGYLLGSISFSYIMGKLLKKVDIRQHGSGNAGATNTLRVLGKGPAIFVLLLDTLKGILAIILALWIVGNSGWGTALAGLLAIIGHNWPVFFGFRGGKGVATTIGVLATLVFYPALFAGILALLTIVFTRFVSLGSLVFMVLTTVLAFIPMGFYSYPQEYLYLLIAVTALSFWRHRSNISRLLQGTENKIGKKV